MTKQNEYSQKISEYITLQQESKSDFPTLAGLAVHLGISKDKLASFEFCSNKKLRNSYILAKNQIEHLILSKSALKIISSSTAHFYLQSAFGYKEDTKETIEQDYKVDIISLP